MQLDATLIFNLVYLLVLSKYCYSADRNLTMKVLLHLCVLALCLINVHARVSCNGEGVSGKRGPPGTELVISRVYGDKVQRSACYGQCKGLCQRNNGDWNGCMSFDMERWGTEPLDSGCKCYGYREQEPTLVNSNTGNHFTHFRCEK